MFRWLNSRRSRDGRVQTARATAAALETLEPRTHLAAGAIVRIAVDDAVCAEVPPGTTREIGEFLIRRTGSIDDPLTVNFLLSSGTTGGLANNGVDYIALDAFVTIPAGRRTAAIPIIPIDDLNVEGDEIVVITLLDGVDYDLDSSAQSRSAAITIKDNDFLPRVTLLRPQPSAFEIGEIAGSFEITRTGPTDLPLTVNLSIAGSARPDVDYARISSTVTIRTGRNKAVVNIRPFSDALFEGDETIRITILPSPDRFTLATNPGRVSNVIFIRDRPLITLTVADPTATTHPTDTGRFLLTRSGPTTTSMRVSYILGGDAVSGTDYIRPGGTITIPAGRSSVFVEIRGRDTRLNTPFKTVTLTLRQLSGYNIDSSLTGNITKSLRIYDDAIGPA